MKVLCSRVISGVHQTTAILRFKRQFLSHPHSWGRNHPSVPGLAGLCCLHPRARWREALLSKKLMAASSPLSTAVGPDPSFARAAPGSAQPDVEARKSPPSVSLLNVEAAAGMAGEGGTVCLIKAKGGSLEPLETGMNLKGGLSSCCTPGNPSRCVVGILGCHSLRSPDLTACPCRDPPQSSRSWPSKLRAFPRRAGEW